MQDIKEDFHKVRNPEKNQIEILEMKNSIALIKTF
jgi:hypothetical protein